MDETQTNVEPGAVVVNPTNGTGAVEDPSAVTNPGAVAPAAPSVSEEDQDLLAALGMGGDEGEGGESGEDPDGEEGEGSGGEEEESNPEGGLDLQTEIDRAFETIAQASVEASEEGGDGGDSTASSRLPASMEGLKLIDVDALQYEGEREMARTYNAAISHLAEKVDSVLQRFEAAEVAERRSVAESAVNAMRNGAAEVLAQYNVQVKPEYLGHLMRKHANIVRAHGAFDTTVALRVFEAEHYASLLAAAKRGPAKTAKPAASTLSPSSGARLGGSAQKTTEDELILRDLYGPQGR